MTREELHELVDIVMDAREKTEVELVLRIAENISLIHYSKHHYDDSLNYPTFSDFTQAVKDYIKSLG